MTLIYFDGNKVDKAQRPRMMAGSGIPSSSGWVETTMIDSHSWFYSYRLAEWFEWRWSHQFVYYTTVYNHISVSKRCGMICYIYICYIWYMFNTNTALQISQKEKSESISNKSQADYSHRFCCYGYGEPVCTFQHPQATPHSRHPSCDGKVSEGFSFIHVTLSC